MHNYCINLTFRASVMCMIVLVVHAYDGARWGKAAWRLQLYILYVSIVTCPYMKVLLLKHPE